MALNRDQDFANYVALKDYRSAISLALAMDQPGRLFALFKEILSIGNVSAADSEGDRAVINGVIRDLPPAELAKLMRHIRTWNANAKASMVAQAILHAIFKLRTTDDISESLGQMTESADGFDGCISGSQFCQRNRSGADAVHGETPRPTGPARSRQLHT